jgi:hypothetical protein
MSCWVGYLLLQPLPVKFRVSADNHRIVGTEDRADLLGWHLLIAKVCGSAGDGSIQAPETALARPMVPSSAERFLRLASPFASLPGRVLVPSSVQGLCRSAHPTDQLLL